MQRTILIFSVCFLFSFSVNFNKAKAYCGTDPDFATLEYLKHTLELRQEMASGFSKKENDTLYYPVQIFIGRQSNGTGGANLIDVLEDIELANDLFINAGLQFFVCSEPIYIDDDNLYDFDYVNDYDLNFIDIEGSINLYIFNKITTNNVDVCGYTFMPGSWIGGDRIVIAQNCMGADKGYVLAHEIGHFFTLWHTHGKTNFGTTDELVNGSNCNSAGDDLCDTPADPNMQGGLVNNNCIYTGSATDDNGDAFEPDVENIMSYARAKCRNMFTPGQYNRARASALIDRNYFCCGDPIAEFTFSQEDNTLYFTNISQGYYTLKWNLGDGTQFESNETYIEHTYNTKGTFTVKLTAESFCGTDVFTSEVTINHLVSVEELNAHSVFEIIHLNNPPLLKADLAVDGKIALEIYDITGRLLYLKAEEFYSKGTHYLEPLRPDLLNQNSVYFLRITFNDQTYFRKILVARE